jgi:transposase InsO family protein
LTIHQQCNLLGIPRPEKAENLRLLRRHAAKPNFSHPHPDHKIYPYLLRGVAIERPNHVWNSDITYLPIQGGFLYRVAVMDWFIRYVLSGELSNTMETAFCLTDLDAAGERSTMSLSNCLYRTAVPLAQIRTDLPGRLSLRPQVLPRAGRIFSLLQSSASAPGARLTNAGRSVLTADAHDTSLAGALPPRPPGCNAFTDRNGRFAVYCLLLLP